MEDRQRLLEILQEVNEDVDFADETALVDDGLIDSFDIVAIISALDDAYGIHIAAKDIDGDNFNSVDNIAKMVKRYQGAV